MLQARARLNANGRVVIPAAVRKALDLRPGDELIIRVADGELRLSTRRQALARARRMIREYIPSDEDLTQSLIDDRRAEAARE
ncbi:MAG: looped-hinge helix binding domain, AbrB family [Geminicoccaceae bacterium]|jgi:AbrB family looped-hinge helix DNA binding protein|nr:looped-hinge helix binding domain, AbrB family [Geminicoccaceae bacterium]